MLFLNLTLLKSATPAAAPWAVRQRRTSTLSTPGQIAGVRGRMGLCGLWRTELKTRVWPTPVMSVIQWAGRLKLSLCQGGLLMVSVLGELTEASQKRMWLIFFVTHQDLITFQQMYSRVWVHVHVCNIYVCVSWLVNVCIYMCVNDKTENSVK